MKKLLFTLGCMASLLSQAYSQKTVDQCLACHAQIEDEPSRGFVTDVHYLRGMTCASCHGGDAAAEEMEVGMDPARGFKGKPTGDAISELCASCHASQDKMAAFGSHLPTNQANDLAESVHGVPSVTASGHAVQCTDCHGVHGIIGPKNRRSPVHPLNVVKTCTRCHGDAAFMRRYNPSLPTDQLTEYRTSVHGQRYGKGDANVATCVSCHGNHQVRSANDVKSSVFPVNLPGTCGTCHADERLMKQYGISAGQYDDYAGSVHGIALLQKRDLGAPACNDCHGNHGAVPPGVESITNVCGTCHALNAELYAQSPHRSVFAKRQLPECETCHGNHAIVAATNKLIGADSDAVCSTCHSATMSPVGYAVAGHMRADIDSLEAAEEQARSLVMEAEQKGMEISEAKFRLREVRQSRLRSRTMIHSFDESQFGEIIAGGLQTASQIRETADSQIKEFSFRRQGFGVATFIITFLAVTLYVYIRRLERRQKRDA